MHFARHMIFSQTQMEHFVLLSKFSSNILDVNAISLLLALDLNFRNVPVVCAKVNEI